MKKILLSAAFLFTLTTFTFGQLQFGAGLALAFDNTNFGVHGKLNFPVTETLNGQGSFTYYFEKDNVSLWSIDADVHYTLTTIGENIKLNPFAGLNITNASVSVAGFGADSTNLGINLGASFIFPAGDKLTVFVEPKLVIDGISGLVVTGGILF